MPVDHGKGAPAHAWNTPVAGLGQTVNGDCIEITSAPIPKHTGCHVLVTLVVSLAAMNYADIHRFLPERILACGQATKTDEGEKRDGNNENTGRNRSSTY